MGSTESNPSVVGAVSSMVVTVSLRLSICPSFLPCMTVYIYITTSHTPRAVFQARLLDNQVASTERYVFGKLSAKCSQRRLCFSSTLLLFPPVEMSSMENRPKGVWNAPSYTCFACPLPAPCILMVSVILCGCFAGRTCFALATLAGPSAGTTPVYSRTYSTHWTRAQLMNCLYFCSSFPGDLLEIEARGNKNRLLQRLL